MVSLEGNGKHQDDRDHVVVSTPVETIAPHERGECERERDRVMVTPAVCHDVLDTITLTSKTLADITLCGGVHDADIEKGVTMRDGVPPANNGQG